MTLALCRPARSWWLCRILKLKGEGLVFPLEHEVVFPGLNSTEQRFLPGNAHTAPTLNAIEVDPIMAFSCFANSYLLLERPCKSYRTVVQVPVVASVRILVTECQSDHDSPRVRSEQWKDPAWTGKPSRRRQYIHCRRETCPRPRISTTHAILRWV